MIRNINLPYNLKKLITILRNLTNLFQKIYSNKKMYAIFIILQIDLCLKFY